MHFLSNIPFSDMFFKNIPLSKIYTMVYSNLFH